MFVRILLIFDFLPPFLGITSEVLAFRFSSFFSGGPSNPLWNSLSSVFPADPVFAP